MTIFNLTASNAVTLAQSNAVSPLVNLTSTPGDDEAVLGIGLTLGFGSTLDVSTIFIRTASNTITFTQTNAREKNKPLTASNTLSLTQTNSRAGSWSPTAGNTVTFGQTLGLQVPVPVSASNTLVFTQSANSSLFARTASSTLVFGQSSFVVIPGEKPLTASNTLVLIQTTDPALLTRTASNVVLLSQSNNRVRLIQNGISLTASNTLSLSQTNGRVRVKASGIALTASHMLTFTQRAIFPIELSASDTLAFTHSTSGQIGKSAQNTIAFTQSVVVNLIRSYTASNTLNLSQSFTFLHLRNQVPVSPNNADSCDITQQYSPLSGGGTSLVRPVPPALRRHTDVFFHFPSTQQCNPTESLTLRTPNFGDRDRNQSNRINRESRGGSLTVFRDPKWPSQRTLVMDFSAIKDSEVDDLLLFLENTLGQKIGFRDWQGRQWAGIIVTPDAALTRTGRDRNDIALELEVDAQVFDYQICTPITFTQSADVELIPV